MRLGHPAMFLALTALAFYVALYVPAFVWLGRRCVAKGMPVWLAIPIVWTSLEYIRAWMITGFAWYFLGHTQYRWSALIQICDVTGVYGVSFLVALVAGAVAVNVPAVWLQRLKLNAGTKPMPVSTTRIQWVPVLTSAFVLVACLVYGSIRRTPPEQFPAGPVFALIQGNFSPEMKHDEAENTTRYRVHDALTREAVLMQPDFIVWPETMFPTAERSVAEGVTDKELLEHLPREILQAYGNETEPLVADWRDGSVRKRLEMHAQASGAALMIGVLAIVAEKDRPKMYNSAAFVRPDLGYSGRYDKVHRVLFGEYIPFKNLFPWLHNLTPFGSDHGIEAGTGVRMFEYGGYRVAPLICFEDTVAPLVRQMAAQRDAAGNECDVLVNLTNDAWFRGSSELDQHLITSAFRCVETRTPMVRCVNGGISAFIDGNGQIREPAEIRVMKEPIDGLQVELSSVKGLRDPETGYWRRQFSGIIFGQAPLDPRGSFYVRFGDWFAQVCLLTTLIFVGLSCIRSKSLA
jgi:apolipoprotein N-acyltransferase